jgi:hypothetical protein
MSCSFLVKILSFSCSFFSRPSSSSCRLAIHFLSSL